MVWLRASWYMVSPRIHTKDILSWSIFLNIINDRVRSFMTTVFYDGIGIFQQDNAPPICYNVWTVRKRFQKPRLHFVTLAAKPFEYQSNLSILWRVGPTSSLYITFSMQLVAVKKAWTFWSQITEEIFRHLEVGFRSYCITRHSTSFLFGNDIFFSCKPIRAPRVTNIHCWKHLKKERKRHDMTLY